MESPLTIRPLDLTGDDDLRATYPLARAASLAGRDHASFWSFAEYAGACRSGDSATAHDLFVGERDGRPVVVGLLRLPLTANRGKAFPAVWVAPDDRGQGLGAAMLDHLVARAAAAGRGELVSSTLVPPDAVADHPHRRFLESHGFEVANVEVVRHLDLPVPEASLAAWAAEAAPHHTGYTLTTCIGDVPDDLVPGLARLHALLDVDAPTGSIEFEADDASPEHFAERAARIARQRRLPYETVALDADGRPVAHSTLAVSLDDDPEVYQWGTYVDRDHRGHRLGLAVKARNLAEVQRRHRAARRVTTQNGEDNGWMVAVNERMGFRPVEVVLEAVRRL